MLEPAIIRRVYRRRVVVLAYHCVLRNPDAVTPRSGIPLVSFLEQITWLERNGFHFISGASLERYLLEAGELPACPVLITVDDGFRNYALEMLPVFEAHNVPSILFVTTDYLDQKRPYSFVRWRGEPARAHDQFLSLESSELVQLARHPLVEIGAHTCSHPNLRALPPAEAQREILDSKIRLEDLLDRPIRYFAYPYGESSDALRQFNSKQFRLGFSVKQGTNGRSADPHLLRRNSLGMRKRSLRLLRAYDALRVLDGFREK
ncbi:MAG: polysaccharide deacetylase family protein [bacterium]